PPPLNNVDLIARIAARAHRPDHVVEVARIDVIIDHDGPAVVVGAGMAMRCHHAGLLGMPTVNPLHHHHDHASAPPRSTPPPLPRVPCHPPPSPPGGPAAESWFPPAPRRYEPK